MKRKRRINYANLRLTIVSALKPKKNDKFRRNTETINLYKQIVIGDTALEAMRCPQAFYKRLKNKYENPIIIRIDFVQVINYISKTNYLI